jgi:hypothetical protein
MVEIPRVENTKSFEAELEEGHVNAVDSDDAERHTHKAATRELKELWPKVANECLKQTGDEGRAIRETNAVVRQQAKDRY